MNCLACLSGLHWECLAASEGCCCPEKIEVLESISGRSQKSDFSLLDPTSTGRKRAAQLKPINPGMSCEWANLKFAGGGVIPLIGCLGNEATHIHHGPDKNTTNNEDYNLHRVCTDCHNRWHTLNDTFYGPRPASGIAFVPLEHEMLPHDAETKALSDEVIKSEIWWKTPKHTRGKYLNE